MILHPPSPSKGDALFKLENYGVYITVLYSRRIRTFISPASGGVFPFDTIESCDAVKVQGYFRFD